MKANESQSAPPVLRRIELLQRTSCETVEGAQLEGGPGDVIEAPERAANYLIRIGKARPTDKPIGKAAPEPGPEQPPAA